VKSGFRLLCDGGEFLTVMRGAAALLFLVALPAAAQTITDGDTIKLNGT
jgi:hypothetical protein